MRWILFTVAGALFAAIVAFLTRLTRARRDTGRVSDQWIAEHRADEPPLK